MSTKPSDKTLKLVLENLDMPPEEFAKAFGYSSVSVWSARYYLRKTGYDIPKQTGGGKPKRVKEAVLANPGASAHEIAEMTGCSANHAQRVINSARHETFSLEARLAESKEPVVPPSIRAFRSMMDGFIRQVQMFMQTNEIDRQEALSLMEETYGKMKEVIENDT